MIDKEISREIEGRLYRYYKQLKFIEKLKSKLILLGKQKEQIEKEKVELRHLDIDTELSMGIDYSREKIQSSRSSAGEAEREIIKYIDNLDKQLKYVIKNILNINVEIRELELQIQDTEFNLSMLNDESQRFIRWKYREEKSIEWISVEMYQGARSTAYRKREELIEEMAHWYNVIK